MVRLRSDFGSGPACAGPALRAVDPAHPAIHRSLIASFRRFRMRPVTDLPARLRTLVDKASLRRLLDDRIYLGPF
jgi:hypothetical protein